MNQPVRKPCFILLLSFLVTGCGGLRPDPVPVPSIQANYPTAEIIACGKRWHGLAICPVVRGQSYITVGINVQGYYGGVLKVDSKNCEIETAMSYTDSQLIPITIPFNAEKNCLLTVTVEPKYPKEGTQDIRIYNFIGWLALPMLQNETDVWEGFTRKVSGNFSSMVRIWVGDIPTVRLVADGCGREDTYDESHNLLEGWLVFDLNKLVPDEMELKTCVMEGFIRNQTFQDILFNIVVSKYDERYTPLPCPSLSFDEDTLIVKASKVVSIIALDGEYEVDYETKFKKFDKTKPHILRLLTVAGRSVLDRWIVAEQKWVCEQ